MGRCRAKVLVAKTRPARRGVLTSRTSPGGSLKGERNVQAGRAGNRRNAARALQSAAWVIHNRVTDQLPVLKRRNIFDDAWPTFCEYDNCPQVARTEVNGKDLCLEHARDYPAFLGITRFKSLLNTASKAWI
jgi:hypothetical protein